MNSELNKNLRNESDMILKGYYDLLDKFMKLQNPSAGNKYIKIVLCIVGGVFAVAITTLLCFLIYRSNFSIESIISVLLAFFSIFMSVFFYFKADETSSKFYDSSYNFMKDVSVTLGKIEERFGEKLNNMNEKLSQMENMKQETKKELQSAENAKDKLINDLLEKANMSEGEKEQYKKALVEKESEAEWLKNRLYMMEIENRNYSAHHISSGSSGLLIQSFLSGLTDTEKNRLINEGRLRSGREKIIYLGLMAGIIDKDRKLTNFGRMIINDLRDRLQY